MRFTLLAFTALTLAASPALAEDAPAPMPKPAAIEADGVPPVPQALAQATRPYMEFRTAGFLDWDPQSKAMLARIAELEPKAVSVVTPDLAASLAAVQAYLERRHLSADEAKASAGKPATQE